MSDGHLVWTVHYFDTRLNRSMASRVFTSEAGARYHACDLMTQSMRVEHVQGPNGHRIEPVELVAWCKSHRTPPAPGKRLGSKP